MDMEPLDIKVETFIKENLKVDLFNGIGEYIWNDGLKYNGDWKNGKMNGKGTLTHPSGETYSGEFKDDKKHGKGYYILSRWYYL